MHQLVTGGPDVEFRQTPASFPLDKYVLWERICRCRREKCCFSYNLHHDSTASEMCITWSSLRPLLPLLIVWCLNVEKAAASEPLSREESSGCNNGPGVGRAYGRRWLGMDGIKSMISIPFSWLLLIAVLIVGLEMVMSGHGGVSGVECCQRHGGRLGDPSASSPWLGNVD